MRVKLACKNTPAGQVTVIRPLVHEPEWPGVIFYASIWFLVEKESVGDLSSLGAVNGVSFWQAEWVSSTLDAPCSVLRRDVCGGKRSWIPKNSCRKLFHDIRIRIPRQEQPGDG
ncbi:MAG: hypothetical protein M0Z41_14020 [Peptococcaceae bacterium]|jgi:hypothetical protein|nr:hypothetical protein [Peptococcaceae bacterium]